MGIEVRNADPDEFRTALDAISTAFLERPDVDRVADVIRETWDPARVWIAVDGSTICGTFRSWPTELTVPGGARQPAAAVAAVTVLPTHRRRGVLRSMAAREHAALRERGEAMGLLYASEFGIYGRFGYAPGTRLATWTVDTRAASVGGTSAGRVELAPVDHDTMLVMRGVFDAWRARQAGEIRRRDLTWEFALGLREDGWDARWKGWVALHRDDAGVVDGYAQYGAESRWEAGRPAGRMEVVELHALSDAAHDDLIRYLVSMDLVTSIKLGRRREAERFPWLLSNSRAATLTEAGDGLWVRLFDVPRALAARTYERTARLVLEVVDDEAWGGHAALPARRRAGRRRLPAHRPVCRPHGPGERPVRGVPGRDPPPPPGDPLRRRRAPRRRAR